MRIIDADELRKAMFSYYPCVNEHSGKGNYRGDTLMDYEVADLIEDCIDNAPTIDPESLGLHSRWEYDQIRGVATCKNCGFERNVDDNFGRAISCPNCGAKMDLEEEK